MNKWTTTAQDKQIYSTQTDWQTIQKNTSDVPGNGETKTWTAEQTNLLRTDKQTDWQTIKGNKTMKNSTSGQTNLF